MKSSSELKLEQRTDIKPTIDCIKQKQLRLFTPSTEQDPILDELRNIDIKNITPIQALNKLYELQKKIK